MNGKSQYSSETFERDGFVFCEVAPARIEAAKSEASRLYPSFNGGGMSASAAHYVYNWFFVNSCCAWNHAEGKVCNEVNKAEFFDSCYEYAFSALYAAKLHFESVRRERGKKLVAGSHGLGEKS